MVVDRPRPSAIPPMPPEGRPVPDDPLPADDPSALSGPVDWESMVSGDFTVMNACCDALLETLESCKPASAGMQQQDRCQRVPPAIRGHSR